MRLARQQESSIHSSQAEVVHRPNCGMDNMAIHVQGFRVRSTSEDERSLRPCYTEKPHCDMTAELQSLSTMLYYMPVMMLNDQAQEIVRNSPESIGAEVWRKLPWEYEPGVGIRYGAMLQSQLKRRVGEHDETDLARESIERDVSKYEQQSNDLIRDAMKHELYAEAWRTKD